MKKKSSQISKVISVSSKEIKNNLDRYKSQIIVIKYGGSAMLDPKLSNSFFTDIKIILDCGVKPIIVHGGGPQINNILEEMNIKHKFHDGMRVTDKKTFRVVEMVLGGLINKDISLRLSLKGTNSIGLSGYDSNLIMAKKLLLDKIDLGQVGIPYKLNTNFLTSLISKNIIPIIAPIGFGKNGEKYNINADITAGFIAHKISARRLLMLTDVKGVIDKKKKLIPELKLKEVRKLISKEVIYGGMIPKVNTCIEAVKKGVTASVILDGRVKHALLKELFSEQGIGTLFRK